MNKKIVIIVVLFLVIGTFLIFKKNKQEAAVIETPIKSEEVTNNNSERIDASDWQTYRNEEYGFEIKLPGDINKWNIEKSVYSKEKSIFKIKTVTLYLNYKLDQNIPRLESDPSLGTIDNMSLWYIDIFPLESWKENLCDSAEGPCRQGSILGKNSDYVFSAGFTNIEGAGYTCIDYPEKLNNFCEVDKNFGLKNINELIDFKIINK